MDIKIMALEAARPHAHDVEDLIKKASLIESYLSGTTTLTPINKNDNDDISPSLPSGKGSIYEKYADDTNQSENTLVTEFTPDALELKREYTEADELISLAKGLTSNLKNLGYDLDSNHAAKYRNDAEKEYRANQRMKAQQEHLRNCNILMGEIPKREDYYETRRVENYRIPTLDRHGKRILTDIALSQKQLELAKTFKEENTVLNVCSGFGLTTLFAAFARQEVACCNRVLVITNLHKNAVELDFLIDDASVNVRTFKDIADTAHAGESYDYILIDNAAYIPYSLEFAIVTYVHKCMKPSSRIIMASVPCRNLGWFHNAYINVTLMDNLCHIQSINWRQCPNPMSQVEAADLLERIGEDAFKNRYENKFRPFNDLI